MDRFRTLRFAYQYFKNHQLIKLDRTFHTRFSKPLIVNLRITDRCNARCKQCDSWKITSKYKDIPTEQWKSILLDLKNYLGYFYLSIFGGEPFLRKDIMELINFTDKLNITTEIVTNGFLPDIIKNVKNTNLSKLTISLDGFEETHDSIRGRGSFKKVMKTINAVEGLDMNLTLNTVLLKQNLHELEDLVRFVTGRNFNGINFKIFCQRGFKEKKQQASNWKELWPEYHEVEKVLDKLIDLKEKGYPIINSVRHLQLVKEYFKNPLFLSRQNLKCRAPYECITILPNGNLRACTAYDLGNLRGDSISRLWRSKKTRAIIEETALNCREICMVRDWLFEDSLLSKAKRGYMVLFKKTENT